MTGVKQGKSEAKGAANALFADEGGLAARAAQSLLEAGSGRYGRSKAG